MPVDTTETVAETQHKAATINQLASPNYSLYVHLLWYPMYYPGGMKVRVSPVYYVVIEDLIVYWPPLKDSNPGRPDSKSLHYHCTQYITTSVPEQLNRKLGHAS